MGSEGEDDGSWYGAEGSCAETGGEVRRVLVEARGVGGMYGQGYVLGQSP